jgi:diaminopimelate decarboxylase
MTDMLHGFPIIDGELIVGGLPLSQLARQVGRTPFYAYDRDRIAARIAELRTILPPRFSLHYAVKANPFAPLLEFMVPRVDGFDIASAGELQRALAAGMDAAHISFAGPGKRREELKQAVAAGVLVNAESLRELDSLAAIAQASRRRARVALRINPAFELKGAGMRMGGGPKPFGIDEEAVPALFADWSRYGDTLIFEGFHIFAGSQNLGGEAIAATQRASYALALRLAATAPEPIVSLNLGGGFGIPYFAHETSLDLAPVKDALHEIAADAAQRMPQAKLCLELGRYLVGEAGIYVVCVIDKKVSRGQTYLVTDGGLHHHLAASGNFGQVIRRNYPVAIGARLKHKVGAGGTADSAIENVCIVGPLCTPLDILADRVDLPPAEVGDLVVVFQSGAYGASASPQGFLSHPPAVEVLV